MQERLAANDDLMRLACGGDHTGQLCMIVYTSEFILIRYNITNNFNLAVINILIKFCLPTDRIYVYVNIYFQKDYNQRTSLHLPIETERWTSPQINSLFR